ncbi:uncharacterized protein METZ01_LOCUS341896, partial [marine metagenome]
EPVDGQSALRSSRLTPQRIISAVAIVWSKRKPIDFLDRMIYTLVG